MRLNWWLIYCGYKTPTAEVLHWVKQNYQSKQRQLHQLYQLMSVQTRRFIEALQTENFAKLSDSMASYHRLMQQLGVSDAVLDSIIKQAHDEGMAAKISGSGLGDCVLVATHKPLPELLKCFAKYQTIPLVIQQDR